MRRRPGADRPAVVTWQLYSPAVVKVSVTVLALVSLN